MPRTNLRVALFVVIIAIIYARCAQGHEGGHHHEHRQHNLRRRGEIAESEARGRTRCESVPTDEEVRQAEAVDAKWAVSLQSFSLVTIDTWIHVIASDEGDGELTADQVSNSFNHLVEAFRGTSFTFRLAGTTLNFDNQWYRAGRGSEETIQMTSNLRRGDAATLNIYFLALSDYIMGYATFPDRYESNPELDGVYVGSNYYAGNSHPGFGEGDTLVHEVGHWLGLYHVFSDSKYKFRFMYCLFGRDNDRVSDTAKMYLPTMGCPVLKNTCLFRLGRDPVSNYMDYSDDRCMSEFTPGQNKRMESQWLEYRASSDGSES